MDLKKIFFSYSRADASNFALQLAVDLKKAGFNVWIDQQDIRAGSEWDLEIEKALESCDCVLFIESEKSVDSNNVLDEVYYAIEQHKIVIPIIYHDSKTPFRLQRLQHIDFSIDYSKGLNNLINELQRGTATELSYPVIKREVKKEENPISTKSTLLIIIITALAIIAATAIIFFINNKKQKISIDEKILFSNESFVGAWVLADVEPKVSSHSGFLKIEEIDEKKVKIKSGFQFYYFRTNETEFLSVLNGFAGCSSCILKTYQPITNEGISIGSQRYSILKVTQQGVGKAGDTTESRGSNTSIYPTVTLNLVNNKTAFIKVQQSDSTSISDGFILPPFTYLFKFTKVE